MVFTEQKSPLFGGTNLTRPKIALGAIFEGNPPPGFGLRGVQAHEDDLIRGDHRKDFIEQIDLNIIIVLLSTNIK